MEDLLTWAILGMWFGTAAFQVSKESTWFKLGVFVVAILLSIYGLYWIENN